eukprot:TRINITY_DN12482_c0_g1_i1.p1 TRINITY_DN12482_c0_g1~~TRINITY_DN12482_c0_g1_i1.p1  ORF type:complete len:615 (-),score=133.15 TRINITY_DN12482_c0_g1_i1:55-1899(-)
MTFSRWGVGLGVASTALGLLSGFQLQQEIKSQQWSMYHDWLSATTHFLAKKLAYMSGPNHEKDLLDASLDAKKHQSDLLMKILRANEKTIYGKECDFELIHNPEHYSQFVPFTAASDYRKYVSSIIKGQQNQLTAESATQIVTVADLENESTMLPTTQTYATDYFVEENLMTHLTTLKMFPSISNDLRKALRLFYPSPQTLAKGNVKVGPVSRSPANSGFLLNFYTSPAVLAGIEDEETANYLHFLFAVKDKKLSFIETSSASVLYYAFQDLAFHWKSVVEDVRSGKLNECLKLSPEAKTQIEALLTPDPERAQELEKLATAFTCCDGYGSGRGALRIWPELRGVVMDDIGDQEFYREKLIKKYIRGLPIVNPVYATPEALLGVNLRPEGRSFLLQFKSVFFEFIPADQMDAERPVALSMGDVRLGGTYELVVTTQSGLYRYRLGDVVQVSKLVNEAVEVEYLYNAHRRINLAGEKTNERHLQSAIRTLEQDWTTDGRMVAEYTFTTSLQSESHGKGLVPRYIAFIEVDPARDPYNSAHVPLSYLTPKDTKTLDDALCAQNPAYAELRKSGGLGSPELVLVPLGSFKQLRKRVIQRGKSFKPSISFSSFWRILT